uniref:Villin like n=1 Tax=Sarcophilus harrisii TaxID=9305 RepID=A0A7N4V2U2_SARHA
MDKDSGLPSIDKLQGLQIWVIEKMKMVLVPQKAYGSFFEGDCYIILHVSSPGRGLAIDIHYWIGKDSAVDEQGAAAAFTAQLDGLLGDVPVQHREVQGYESEVFKSYFKKGIIYKKGGLTSGFKHVETNMYNIQRLLHIKGKKPVTATEVDLTWDSFNKGDVFLLDLGKVLIQWNGPEANLSEKSRGLALARNIRDGERGGRAQIGVVDEEQMSSAELLQIMETVLGPRAGALRDAVSEERADEFQKANLRLYHLYEKDEDLVVQEIATRPLTQDLLQHEDCHILDQGGFKIYVWRGRGSSKEEKKAAFSRAVGFIQAKGYPATTNVEVVNDGFESAMFKQGFGTKNRAALPPSPAKVEPVKFDVTNLQGQPELAAEQRMVDDGSGKVEVWRIEDLHKKPVDPKKYGQFYGGDCYLVLYTYQKSGRAQYIIYIWQGRYASVDEVTASALNALELDHMYQEEAVQVRVTMGKEPRHFLAIFRGRLVVFQGGGEPPSAFWALVGEAARPSAPSWFPQGCSGDEREMARMVAPLGRTNAGGGSGAPLGRADPHAPRPQERTSSYQPRLFECSNQTGRFIMTEIMFFSQDDLDEDDIMLLDTWEEKKEAVAVAREYLKSHPAGRDPATPVIVVKQGHEPLTFTGWFNAWDPYKWNVSPGLPLPISAPTSAPAPPHLPQPLPISIAAPSPISAPAPPHLFHGNSNCNSSDAPPAPSCPAPAAAPGPPSAPIPREQLINKAVEDLPEGVDPSRKEFYLSDSDFQDLFGKSKDEFYRMAKWKQQSEKKQHGLF